MNFAKDYETDDSERAELRGVQDQEMLHVARKLSMCCSTDKHTKLPIPASVKVDVSDVDQNVASMGRLLRAKLDLHLLNAKKWLGTINGDSSLLEAPLLSKCYLHLGESGSGKTTAGARVVPIATQSGLGGSGARLGSEWSEGRLSA